VTVPTVGQNSDTSAAADLMTVVGDVDDVAHFDDFIRGEVRRGDRDVEFPDRPLIGISDQKTKQFLWDREIVGPKMEGMHSPPQGPTHQLFLRRLGRVALFLGHFFETLTFAGILALARVLRRLAG